MGKQLELHLCACPPDLENRHHVACIRRRLLEQVAGWMRIREPFEARPQVVMIEGELLPGSTYMLGDGDLWARALLARFGDDATEQPGTAPAKSSDSG